MESLIDRVMARVQVGSPEECWPWLGKDLLRGYGRIKNNYKRHLVHRVVLINSTGKVGEVARHKCDNPICCNPSHLEWGSQQDNVDDREKRGRSAKGVRNGNSKFTASDLVAIKRALAHPYWGICKDLSKEYGVDLSTISRIKRSASYRSNI